MKIIGYRKISGLMILMLMILNFACCEETSGQVGERDAVNPPAETGNGGYLFAHMVQGRYARLFYSVSRDGVTWKTLNNGNTIIGEYYGHPDLCEGPDVFGDAPSRWYMIGTVPGTMSEILMLWHSTDLVVWERMDLDGSNFVVKHLGVTNEYPFIGAPKMFYDEDSEQFIITWHAGEFLDRVYDMQYHGYPQAEINQMLRKNWETQRTCFTLTKDFKTYTRPRRLFTHPDDKDDAPVYFTGADEGIGLIDVIIRKYDGKYYAIVKDERWDDKAPETYKSIRIASSDNLLGPYTNPGPSISPHWREAPVMLRTPEGKFRVYYEDYVKHVYEMREADAIEGAPWNDVKLSAPVGGRHGCVVWVDEQTYQGILKAYNY